MAYGGSSLSRYNDQLRGFPSITLQNYASEVERKESFRGCSFNGVFIENLVGAGFFSTGVGQEVQCFQCAVKHSNWHQGDIPFNVHQLLNPCCPFLRTFSCKKKPPRTQMVVASDVPLWQRTTYLQLCRETTLQSYPRSYRCDGERQLIPSFPAVSGVDHNAMRGLVEEDFNNVMSPQHPSPAHQLPVQSMQATDHSAILIGNTLKPLQMCSTYAGVNKVGTVSVPVNVSNSDYEEDGKDEDKVTRDKELMCKICYSAPVKCVYLPCGHIGACRSCVSKFQEYSSCCPFCNTLVTVIHDVYFP